MSDTLNQEMYETVLKQVADERDHWAREAHTYAGSIKELRELVRRATELLDGQVPPWELQDKIDQWLKDAGVEK